MTKNQYRAVVVRCDLSRAEQETIDAINKSFVEVSHFLDKSLNEFRKILYYSAGVERAENGKCDLPMRTVSLLAKRFGDTVLKNRIIPLDGNTAKVVSDENGKYYISAKLIGNEIDGKPRTPWYDIPISKNDNRYYSDIINKFRGAITLYEKGNDLMAVFSMKVESKCGVDLPAVIIGIDLNMEKNAVVVLNPETEKFEKNFFFDISPYNRTLDRLQTSRNRVTKKVRKNNWTEEIKDEVAIIDQKINGTIKNVHGHFIEKLLEVAEEYLSQGANVVFVIEDLTGIIKRVGGSRKINNWLHSKWCYNKFKLILESKGFPVKAVYPHNTSSNCHRCGKRGTIHGRKGRLFSCEFCGLKNFNRDLNAARNIALRGRSYYAKRWERKEKEGLVSNSILSC